MKGKYLRRIGGLILATLMLSGIAFVSSSTVQAQGRRRGVTVRPNPHRVYRPGFRYRSRFDVFGYDHWGYDRWDLTVSAGTAGATNALVMTPGRHMAAGTVITFSTIAQADS